MGGREPIVVGGEAVEAGARKRLELPVARLPTGTPLDLSVEVVHGAGEGPTVWLSGATHGDELDGIEIIRQVLEELEPADVAGTVLAVPVVNLYGALNESRYLPDRRDLNRSFPGSARGSMASQLAHLLMREVVSRCAYGIDFHCGSDNRDNLPQIRADLSDEETRTLARTFGAPVMIAGTPPDGSLRRAALRAGARTLLYEGGEASRFTPSAIEVGVAGTRRVLAALGMVDGGGAPPAAETIHASGTTWLRAPRSGVCRMDVELGQRLRKGERVAIIRDVLGRGPKDVRAREGGIVIGRRVNPLVYRGEAIVHIAST